MANKITDAEYGKALSKAFGLVGKSMRDYTKVLLDKKLSQKEKDTHAVKSAKEVEGYIEELEKIERQYYAKDEK